MGLSIGFRIKLNNGVQMPTLRLGGWQMPAGARRGGKARGMGGRNDMAPPREALRASGEVVPAVNQIELSPFLYPKDVIEFCKKHVIAVEAYSPLTKGHRINDQRLKAVGQKYGKTVPQILIRWGLQHGFIEIPKSSRPEHIKENAQVFDFEIRAEDMRAPDSLGEGLHVAWDPTDEP